MKAKAGFFCTSPQERYSNFSSRNAVFMNSTSRVGRNVFSLRSSSVLYQAAFKVMVSSSSLNRARVMRSTAKNSPTFLSASEIKVSESLREVMMPLVISLINSCCFKRWCNSDSMFFAHVISTPCWRCAMRPGAHSIMLSVLRYHYWLEVLKVSQPTGAPGFFSNCGTGQKSQRWFWFF